jgi:hypothetical protein
MGAAASILQGERRPLHVWVAAIPLGLSVLLLQLFGPTSGPLMASELEALRSALVPSAFQPGLISFVAVAAAHICACTVVLVLALDMLRTTPNSAGFRRAGLQVAAGVGVAVVAVMILSDANAGRISYRAFETFFTRASGAAPIVSPLWSGGPTPLALATTLPTLFGVVAVAMTSAAANAQFRFLEAELKAEPPSPEPDGATPRRPSERVCAVHDRAKRCLYALAVVLVTSTVAASLYFHLPSQLPLASGFEKSPEAAFVARMADFGAELSLLWGMVFSLTLAAAVGLPLFLIQARLRVALEEPPLSQASKEERDVIVSSGVLAGGREQVKLLTTLLAPLIAGPVANLVQSAALF